MLAGLFGKKCDHPMADVKSAQLLLEDLPRNDALKSVTELTEWIESVTSGAEFRLVDQSAVLCLLDETAQFYARKLACEFFSLPDMNAFQGNRLCMALANLSRHTADAYYTLFMRHCSGDKGANKAQLPQLVARAIRAMRKQLKYAAVRYSPHDDALWQRLAQLYQHAEQQHYLETPLALYNASSEPVTVMREAGLLMAWQACGLDALSPLGIHLTERIVSQYASSLEISASLSGQVLFGFDLANALGVVRVDLETAAHPTMRYLSSKDMQTKLDALLLILDKHVIPQELNLGGVFVVERVQEAARHVKHHLLDKPLRKSQRRPFKAALNIVSGYHNVIGRCKHESDSHPAIQVMLENASSGGFLAVLSAQGAADAKIGNLLGTQTDGVARLGVSITRRLLRDAEGRMHLGAEMLATRVSEVVLRRGGEGDHSALWLHAREHGENVMLLMPANTFSMHSSLKTHLEDRDYLLIPVALQESGADYDLASFRLIQQEEGQE